jgi:Fur family transcriptional regulator, zinc uptake regulator
VKQPKPGSGSFAVQPHDHARCRADALRTAERICAGSGARLTGLRRRVLELVWASHRPIGAYAILGDLQRSGRAAPPTVYRALDFLIEHGLAHRIASLNAYVGCVRPGEPHAGQFLLCARCKDAAELQDSLVAQALAASAAAAGFRVEQQTVELEGVCPRCLQRVGGDLDR